MNKGQKSAIVIGAGTAALVVAGGPAALIVAGTAWAATDTEYGQAVAASITATKDRLFNRKPESTV